jgi:ADP-heptose:LPS heptosyltransferase
VNPKKIVLLRALPGLGDMLCVTPALAALRTNHPEAQINLIGMKWARDWAARYTDYIDQFIEFPGFPGMEQGWKSHSFFVDFLRKMVDEEYDMALQLHGSGIVSNYFISLLGAELTTGFYTPLSYCPDRDTFLAWKEEESEVGRYCRLLRYLSIPVMNEDLIFPMTEKDELEFEHLKKQTLTAEKPIACIHPGASSVLRICPLEVFAKVAGQLGERGYQVVLTGKSNEAIYTRQISEMAKTSIIDLAGKTTLGCLAKLIQHSEITVCNDTGISHLADATKTKSVVIFMENPPSRWAPLNDSLHRVVDVRNQATDINTFPIQGTAERVLEEVNLLTTKP